MLWLKGQSVGVWREKVVRVGVGGRAKRGEQEAKRGEERTLQVEFPEGSNSSPSFSTLAEENSRTDFPRLIFESREGGGAKGVPTRDTEVVQQLGGGSDSAQKKWGGGGFELSRARGEAEGSV